MINPVDEKLEVTVEDGHVLIEGGPGVALTMTPHAAAETSDALLHGSTVALGQRQMSEMRRAEAEKLKLR